MNSIRTFFVLNFFTEQRLSRRQYFQIFLKLFYLFIALLAVLLLFMLVVTPGNKQVLNGLDLVFDVLLCSLKTGIDTGRLYDMKRVHPWVSQRMSFWRFYFSVAGFNLLMLMGSKWFPIASTPFALGFFVLLVTVPSAAGMPEAKVQTETVVSVDANTQKTPLQKCYTYFIYLCVALGVVGLMTSVVRSLLQD